MTAFGNRGGIFGLSPYFQRLVTDDFEAEMAQFNGDVQICRRCNHYWKSYIGRSIPWGVDASGAVER